MPVAQSRRPWAPLLGATAVATFILPLLRVSDDPETKGSGVLVVNPARGLDAVVPGAGEIIDHGTPARLRTGVTGLGPIVAEPEAST